MMCTYLRFPSLLSPLGVKGKSPLLNYSSHPKRNFSSDGDEGDSNKGKLLLMKFPFVTWPNGLLSLRNLFYAALVIRPFYDREFKLRSFTTASKHALVKVSEELSNGNFDYLMGLVDPKALEEVKESFARLTLVQRQKLKIAFDDIFFSFPYQLGIIHSGEGENRVYAEITMCYHILEGYNKGHTHTEDPKKLVDKLTIANYRYIREITKGIEDEWTINILNHFKPHEHDPVSLATGGRFK